MTKIRLVGVPTDYGTNRRGVDMGPSAVRYAGVVDALRDDGHDVTDAGDVDAPRCESEGVARRVCETVADRVAAATDAGDVPFVVGGDHSVSIGSLLGTARTGGGDADNNIGVLWLDAHADFNTRDTTPSGNVHGMVLAAATGYAGFEGDWSESIDASNVALVGVRDVDEGERDSLRDSDVSAFTVSEIDERGIASVIDDALGVTGTDALHVSLDMDFLDPKEAPGVGTPVTGGATYREAHTALEIVADSADVRSVDLVEVNPILDERNRTAKLSVDLLRSLFGRSVL